MKNIFLKIRAAAHKVTHPRTTEDSIRIHKLRQGVRTLIFQEENTERDYNSLEGNMWRLFRSELRHNILFHDPRYFLQWPIIKRTMFYPGHEAEVLALKKSPHWNTWKLGIEECPIGYPTRYANYHSSSGNLIHHAYELLQLEHAFGVRLENLKNIFEFGGGYGSTARLFYQMGFRGSYTIFDFPEFSLLQEFFLSSLREKARGVKYITHINNLQKVSSNPDLFIAAWSLSEAPFPVRDEILSHVPEPKYYLIAYQGTFQDMNNINYFNKFQNEKIEYRWVHYPMQHIPGNYFLLGERISNK
ncbi:MAG: hypothetical protein B7X04_00600 [Parcubacteria group bacterium 21-54-25]|nr:MAG: hypothetical protein B7X04_00600 [Parcubacteria group bacterium 21-54-25]HQU07446.1 hypothetical protein [Candidatus Paceibacterota bacterium]